MQKYSAPPIASSLHRCLEERITNSGFKSASAYVMDVLREIALACFVSAGRSYRGHGRHISMDIVEVHLNFFLDRATKSDSKGTYKTRAGRITDVMRIAGFA